MIDKLVECLRALAAPAQLQLARFPDVVCRADELALEYTDALLVASSCPQLQFTEEQRRALRNVDDLLDMMSGQESAQLWTDAALREAQEWSNVRPRCSRRAAGAG